MKSPCNSSNPNTTAKAFCGAQDAQLGYNVGQPAAPPAVVKPIQAPAQPNARPAQGAEQPADLRQLPVAALKQRLVGLGLKPEDYLEKGEMVQAILDKSPKPAPRAQEIWAEKSSLCACAYA